MAASLGEWVPARMSQAARFSLYRPTAIHRFMGSVMRCVQSYSESLIDPPPYLTYLLQWYQPRQSAVQSVEPTLSLLFEAAERGERPAADTLFSALYSELHRLARRELARRSFSTNMSATTLLHEAY